MALAEDWGMKDTDENKNVTKLPNAQLLKWIDAKNIADDLDEEELDEIGARVKEEFEIDDRSRSEWMEKTKKAMDLALQVTSEKVYPWPKASNVIFPLMTNAATQFAARAYPAIINGRNVVKGVILGTDDGDPALDAQGQPMQGPMGPLWLEPPGSKRLRADRIAQHMSFQLLDEMPEWEVETDKLLHIIPIVGCVFRKTYFDPTKGRNVSLMVLAQNLVVNYNAKSLDLAPRISEEIKFYRREIDEFERAGLFREIVYSTSPDSMGDNDAPVEFVEQHRFWDLDGDGYTEPYIITVDKQTSQVVRIVARYDADGIKVKGNKILKIDPVQYFTQYNFLPSFDAGIYGVGFGQILAPVNAAVNTSLNQLIDAGHLQNTGGGFIGKGLSMNTGAIRFQPGEFKMVNVSGATVKESVVPLDFRGPSPTLFNLLGLLIEAGKDIAAIKDVLTGEQQNGNVPATTTMALIEQGLKVFTGIYKRVYLSLKEEYKKLYRLNRIYLTEEASYRLGNDWKKVTRTDYEEGAGVEPVSDPTMVSDFQRMSRAQFLLATMEQMGQVMNPQEVIKRVLDAANIENPDRIINQNPQPPPEIMLKQQEMQIKGVHAKATEMKDTAQAILFMAQAKAAAGENELESAGMQLDLLGKQLDGQISAMEAQHRMVEMDHERDMMDQEKQLAQIKNQGMSAQTGAKTQQAQSKAQASSQVDNIKVSQARTKANIGNQKAAGLTPKAPPPIEEPPMPGAMKAPDGEWYLHDHTRPGKFLKVKRK